MFGPPDLVTLPPARRTSQAEDTGVPSVGSRRSSLSLQKPFSSPDGLDALSSPSLPPAATTTTKRSSLPSLLSETKKDQPTFRSLPTNREVGVEHWSPPDPSGVRETTMEKAKGSSGGEGEGSGGRPGGGGDGRPSGTGMGAHQDSILHSGKKDPRDSPASSVTTSSHTQQATPAKESPVDEGVEPTSSLGTAVGKASSNGGGGAGEGRSSSRIRRIKKIGKGFQHRSRSTSASLNNSPSTASPLAGSSPTRASSPFFCPHDGEGLTSSQSRRLRKPVVIVEPLSPTIPKEKREPSGSHEEALAIPLPCGSSSAATERTTPSSVGPSVPGEDLSPPTSAVSLLHGGTQAVATMGTTTEKEQGEVFHPPARDTRASSLPPPSPASSLLSKRLPSLLQPPSLYPPRSVDKDREMEGSENMERSIPSRRHSGGCISVNSTTQPPPSSLASRTPLPFEPLWTKTQEEEEKNAPPRLPPPPPSSHTTSGSTVAAVVDEEEEEDDRPAMVTIVACRPSIDMEDNSENSSSLLPIGPGMKKKK